MGVYHLSGLGLSPGAVTMPLTAVYILQAAAQLGHEKAKMFFAHSGETEKKGSYEKIKGFPEALIVFTSEEAIEGRKRLRYRSNWFGMRGGGGEKVHKPITKYVRRLLSYINDTFSLGFKPPKYFYLVKVNHQSFEDAFYKIGVTIEGMRDKEVWLNLIGGTNQINLALLLAGAYTAVSLRYYYIFQTEDTLEPSWIDKPRDKATLFKAADEILQRWYFLPPINIGIGFILRELYLYFHHTNTNSRGFISKSKVLKILKQRGYDSQFIPKLIEFGYIVSVNESAFKKGPMLDRTVEMFFKIEKQRIRNTADWKRWAESEGILEVASFD
ncbi:hypothetical protein [Thermococcus barophilus]|uniref:CRISPR-associated protein n=1 Tax=Thermococcus barophilus TaxID=55802 RepID=A0A0S1XEZ7_THEBA|nr:hypothetical protein [Thermococcus barophilus]ALM76264.1 hypothetical protein TBCH5v1_2371 [Thermococcus barophilus]